MVDALIVWLIDLQWCLVVLLGFVWCLMFDFGLRCLCGFCLLVCLVAVAVDLILVAQLWCLMLLFVFATSCGSVGWV